MTTNDTTNVATELTTLQQERDRLLAQLSHTHKLAETRRQALEANLNANPDRANALVALRTAIEQMYAYLLGAAEIESDSEADVLRTMCEALIVGAEGNENL